MSEWDEHAASWDDNEAVRAYADAAHASLMSAVTDGGIELSAATVCDFGCGTGLLTERLVDACDRIDAIDTSAAMREVLAAKIGTRGWTDVRVLEQLPAGPQGYGLIVCSSVLSFVDDHPATVALLSTHLAPGGLLVHWDWEAEPDDPEGGLTRDEMESALLDAGLESVSVGPGFEIEFDGDVMRPLMGSGRRPA